MDAEIGFSQISPPAFDGENYQMWAVRMEAYLQALDVWEPVEEADFHIPALPENPTLAQLRHHKERKTKKTKAKAILFAAVSSSIFTRIMTLESANAIWNYLRDEYQGNERIKGMKVLNLIKEFEVLKMKESETIKEYSDKLLKIANQEVVAQSTAEAEFVAATAAVNQAIWLKKILSDLQLEQEQGTKILVDNQAAIAISLNPVFHGDNSTNAGPGTNENNDGNKNDNFYEHWFYLVIGLGFAAGILVPYLILATRRQWSDAYFNLVDEIADRISYWGYRAMMHLKNNH
ncbi:hypothetical protein GH714_017668 [Hevea brasiliensis]|uniref:Uncharacterized protein n=1 Tax=Hevea brasiliensis TaxID=3981 RepID=A0A6A6N559_HEVBR|nr:hypothetical protein GH714_017668 [Hevea brasiliensis]